MTDAPTSPASSAAPASRPSPGPMELDLQGLDRLIAALRDEGYRVLGPTLGDGAIVYDEIRSADELPRGWIDDQDAGRYRLRRGDRDRYFDHVVGPHSWKKYLFPPRLSLLKVRRGEDGAIEATSPDADAFADPAAAPPRMAFLGVRSCELAAIAIQDKVFLEGAFVDPHYARRRDGLFLVAVNCTRPGGTCFCASMDTGPRARSGAGHDLALTELADGFVVEAATEAGARVLARLGASEAAAERVAEADRALDDARGRMGRSLDRSDLPGLLLDRPDHPRWEQVAERCLSCTNCTMVCPTCFCHAVEDVNDLRLEETTRERVWDSCFSVNFSYVHGGARRPETRDRYRQWLTHKFDSWHEQFGSSGCVGCGRCITWCPPGIDVTEEIAAIRGPAVATVGPAPSS